MYILCGKIIPTHIGQSGQIKCINMNRRFFFRKKCSTSAMVEFACRFDICSHTQKCVFISSFTLTRAPNPTNKHRDRLLSLTLMHRLLMFLKGLETPLKKCITKLCKAQFSPTYLQDALISSTKDLKIMAHLFQTAMKL